MSNGIVDITIGKKVYEGRSCNVSCYHVGKDGREQNVFAFKDEKKQGVKCNGKSFSRAIDYLSHDDGGWWSTMGVEVDNDSIFKMLVSMNMGIQRYSTAFYFLVREKGAVGVLSYLRVPDQNRKTRAFTETRIPILSGRFEPIELETAESVYGVVVPPIFRAQATNQANYEGMLELMTMREAEEPLPYVKHVSFITTQGVSRTVKRRSALSGSSVKIVT